MTRPQRGRLHRPRGGQSHSAWETLSYRLHPGVSRRLDSVVHMVAVNSLPHFPQTRVYADSSELKEKLPMTSDAVSNAAHRTPPGDGDSGDKYPEQFVPETLETLEGASISWESSIVYGALLAHGRQNHHPQIPRSLRLPGSATKLH